MVMNAIAVNILVIQLSIINIQQDIKLEFLLHQLLIFMLKDVDNVQQNLLYHQMVRIVHHVKSDFAIFVITILEEVLQL